MNCTHQHTYYEGGDERCTDCGGSRKKGTAKWVPDKHRHPSSLRPKAAS